MKDKRTGSKSIIKIIAVLVAVAVIGGSVFTFAMIDETNSVHIDASEIEDSTLIIGSHLIYLGAMTDQIYQIAMESAEEANQYNRYYKSELAGGTWYNVTEAGELADITTGGVVVEDREIEELFMTHHTKSDGITYDLRTGDSVSIFDINDPYDLEGMSELEPIKLQYDTLVNTEDPSETIERDILYIEEVYKKNRRTEETDRIDAEIDHLQAYYEILVRDGADSAMSDMVMTVMEKLDAARRAEVLAPLNETELQTMSKVVSREFIYIEGEITGEFKMSEERQRKIEEATKAKKEAAEAAIKAKEAEINEYKATINNMVSEDVADIWLERREKELEELKKELASQVDEAIRSATESIMNEKREALDSFVLNTDLVTAIGEAMTNVQESYIDYSSKMIAEGSTVLSNAEYEITMELIDRAEGELYSLCDESVMKLIYLDRINNSVIREEDAERQFIEESLMRQAERAYSASLGEGEGEAYKTLSSMAAAATKANVLKTQKNNTEIIRNELQFIIQAYTDRMSAEEAMDHIAGRIDNIGSFSAVIQNDAYHDYAVSSVDAHYEWLNSTMRGLQDSLGNRTMDGLNDKKDDLQTERMTALDKNNLALAKKLETQIEAIDKEIEELEKYLNDIINSSNTSASEKSKAAAQLSEGSASATLQNMKNNALEDLRNGVLDGIENIIDGIGALADVQPESALGALKDIYQELSNQELMGNSSYALDDLLDKVENVTAENMDKFTGDIPENDIGSLIKSFIDENMGGIAGDSTGEVDNILEMGSSDDITIASVMDGLSDEQMAVILAGLGMFAEQTGSNGAGQIVSDYSKFALDDGSSFVFERYTSDPLANYVPTDKLAMITGYRYIFNDSQKAVTLQKGSQYYKFEAFSIVAYKGTDEEDMSNPAGFMTVIYIPSDTAEKYFGVITENIYNTGYGVLLTEDMRELATAFFDYLLQAGGEL